jgi:hypothetical protein
MSDVTFQPALYYEVTARDDNPDCRNFEQTFTVPEFYSNAGTNCYVTCGLCGSTWKS